MQSMLLVVFISRFIKNVGSMTTYVKRGDSMGFWNSIQRKARKEHTCLHCQKAIQVGEIYQNHAGIF